MRYVIFFLFSKELFFGGDDEIFISDWEIVWDYFKKWYVFFVLVFLIIILVYIVFVFFKKKCGFEFWIIYFFDFLMELIMLVVVVI